MPVGRSETKLYNQAASLAPPVGFSLCSQEALGIGTIPEAAESKRVWPEQVAKGGLMAISPCHFPALLVFQFCGLASYSK